MGWRGAVVSAATGTAGLWRKDKELWTGERLGAHTASAAHAGAGHSPWAGHLPCLVVLIFHTSPAFQPSPSPDQAVNLLSPGAPGRAFLSHSAQSSPSGLPSIHPHLGQLLAVIISASPVCHMDPQSSVRPQPLHRLEDSFHLQTWPSLYSIGRPNSFILI